MAVILNNEQQDALPNGVLDAMERVASLSLTEHDLPPDAEISLTICNNRTIRELNKKWRFIDAATDVLSFPLLDEADAGAGRDILLGDIVISLEQAKKQAADYGHSLRRELLYLFVHGILHLLGYDHQNEGEQTEMREVEEHLLSVVGALRNEL
ncbi:MAG: rRNA maturation RNase YbeY [Bacillota bacterium]|nr:rRNA maturation RNase YbeY [Bacillota bacterium]MDW7683480.1 rRNA maturation RNase YbeY [Bacillota bacterium]